MIKFTVKETRQAMKTAWVIRKKAAEKWSCKVSEIHMGLCLRLAYKHIKGNKNMCFSEWYSYYEAHKKTFDYILYQQVILGKNGKLSISQKFEFSTTSPNYQILVRDKEELENEVILKMIELFNRKTILYKQRYYIYALTCFNVVKAKIRSLRRFGMVSEGENMGVIQKLDNSSSSNDYDYLLLNMALKEGLDFTDYTICKMREYKFKQQEIAVKLGISRQAVHKREKKLAQKAAGII